MEKPILFNTEMVKAILEGRKTTTRRVVKPQPICYGPNITFKGHNTDFFLSAEKGNLMCRVCGNDPQWSTEGKDVAHYWKPPYAVGDTLWVRETWQESECFDFSVKGQYAYLANEFEYELSQEYQIKWRPSIHMPRSAARLFLKVTDVRCEKLWDITESDAVKEGAGKAYYIRDAVYHDFKDKDNYKDGFRELWNSCYDWPKSWTANPWVWVIEFERMV